MSDNINVSPLSAQINNLAVRIAKECKLIYTKLGDTTQLNTDNAESLVKAINSLKINFDNAMLAINANSADIDAAETAITALQERLNSIINDTTASTNTVYSSSKVVSEITKAKQEVKDDLLGGAGTAYDTLNELAELIESNQDSITALQNLAAGHVKYDDAQELTDAQKKQARDNINAVSQDEIDFSAIKATIASNKSEIDTLKADIGDLNTNFVTTFEAELNNTTE
jgi:chromosome segregation ATPase